MFSHFLDIVSIFCNQVFKCVYCLFQKKVKHTNIDTLLISEIKEI